MEDIYSMTSGDAVPLPVLPMISSAAGPLYRQIVDGLQREISKGRLAPGAPLPSFRKLAEQLLVSVITVKRAYEELEQEGIIYRRQGLGTFVAENGNHRSREAKIQRARTLVAQAVTEAAEAGLTLQEIQKLMQQELRQPVQKP